MSGQDYGLTFPGKDAVLGALGHEPSLVPQLETARSIRSEQARHVWLEGDNLEALRLLGLAYAGKVALIYIDPPYNTGHDFVYRDSFGETKQSFLARTGQIDGAGAPLVANPRSEGRFHSAWLAMMYPRLWAARRLLADDGLVCVSIDDHEVHRLRMVLDEIFGEDCFIAQIVVVGNRGGRDYLRIAVGHEYILCYGGSPDAPVAEFDKVGAPPPFADERGPYELRELRNRNPKFHPGNRPNLFYPVWVDPQRLDPHGCAAVSCEPREGFAVEVEPRNSAGKGSVWRWSRKRLESALVAGDAGSSEVVARVRRDGRFNVYEKYRKRTRKPKGLWDEPELRSERGTIVLRELLGDLVFDHPKPVELVRRCLQLSPHRNGIVLDFFAGSGTTAQAVLEQNADDGGARRSVLVQLREPVPPDSVAANAGYQTVSDIAYARLQRVFEAAPAQGLRWFSLAPDPRPRFAVGTGIDATGYLDALAAHEELVAAAPREPFALALPLGIGLDAGVSRVGSSWLVVRDRGSERVAAIGVGKRIDAEAAAELDVPEGSSVLVRDSDVDDEVRADLAARFVLMTV